MKQVFLSWKKMPARINVNKTTRITEVMKLSLPILSSLMKAMVSVARLFYRYPSLLVSIDTQRVYRDRDQAGFERQMKQGWLGFKVKAKAIKNRGVPFFRWTPISMLVSVGKNCNGNIGYPNGCKDACNPTATSTGTRIPARARSFSGKLLKLQSIFGSVGRSEGQSPALPVARPGTGSTSASAPTKHLQPPGENKKEDGKHGKAQSKT